MKRAFITFPLLLPLLKPLKNNKEFYKNMQCVIFSTVSYTLLFFAKNIEDTMCFSGKVGMS